MLDMATAGWLLFIRPLAIQQLPVREVGFFVCVVKA